MRLIRSALFIATGLFVTACTEKIIEAPVRPDPPTSLQAVVVPPKSIRLTWAAAVEASGYSIYRNSVKVGDVSALEFVDADLSSNATYSWFVVARTSDGRLSVPSEPVTMGFGDIGAPTVASTSPVSSATGLSRLVSAAVTFSEDMLPVSIANGAITAKITSTGAPVYGSVNYDAATKTADFWPFALLPARTNITLTVGTAAQDVAGNRIAAPFSVSFTTGDSPASNAELPANAEPLLISAGTLTPNGSGLPRDLYKMRADGTGRINLTNNPSADINGSWSPDGRHVVFSSDRNGTFDIYVMRQDGSARRQLTFEEKDQTQPVWSSDAARIFFKSTRDGTPPTSNMATTGDIWAMNADGTGSVNLTRTPMTYDERADPSPDGQKLLYTSTEYGTRPNGTVGFISQQLTLSNADGTNPKPLRAADVLFQDDVGAWSPDGTQVAFSAFNIKYEQFNENFLLFLVNADGTNLRQLTTGGSQRSPAWSPDARSLMFSVSGEDEFWARFGKIGVATMDLSTRVRTTIAPQTPSTEVMSPQSWRR